MLPKNIQPGTLGQKAGIMKYTIIKTDMFTHKIPTKILRVMTERDREKLKNKKSCKPQAPSSKQR